MHSTWHIANPQRDPSDQTYIQETANLVEQIGIIGVEGTKSIAVPFCNAVIKELQGSNSSGEYVLGYVNVLYRGYLYCVIDLDKYELKDMQRLLEDIDEHIPI